MGKSKGRAPSVTMTPGQIALQGKAGELFDRLLQELGLTGGDIGSFLESGVSPFQETQLQEIFNLQRQRGTEDIQRLGTQLAGRRGLNLFDTPIGQPLLEEQRKFSEGMGASEAQSRLGLSQQAIQNRLALLGATTGGVSQLFGTTQPQVLPGMQGQGSLGGTLGGIGGLLGGVGTVGSWLWPSSARFKEALEPVKDDAALRALRAMPIYRWNYKGQQEKHIGPITEQSPAEIVTEDRLKLKLADALGLNLAATKALDRKVEKLEKKIG